MKDLGERPACSPILSPQGSPDLPLGVINLFTGKLIYHSAAMRPAIIPKVCVGVLGFLHSLLYLILRIQKAFAEAGSPGFTSWPEVSKD